MTRVRVLITFALLSTLTSAWNVAAREGAEVVFNDHVHFRDQMRAAQALEGGGQIMGGQLSLAEGECAPRPQALVQWREADGTVIWERAAKAAPERGALPLFAGFGKIDPQLVATSTVHAVAREPHGGDIFVAGDVILSWLTEELEPATAWGGFVVRLTPLGEPIAERYFGFQPTGMPLAVAGVDSTCSAPVCGAQQTSTVATVSLRELVVTQSGEVMARGYRRANGERQPFLAVMSAGLDQVLWSGSGDKSAEWLAPGKLATAQPKPKPLSPLLDPHQQSPDAFTVTLGTLNEGSLAELSASDDQYLTFFAEIQNTAKSLGEVVAEFHLTPQMPVIEEVTVEVYVELCTTVTISIGGGFIGNEMVDLARQQLCPFDEPTFKLAVPQDLAERMGFGRRSHEAAGDLSAFVAVGFDMQREQSVGCGSGMSCATQGESGDIDLIIMTTDYP